MTSAPIYAALKKWIRNSPRVYGAYVCCRHYIRFLDWIMHGRPLPPPHYVKQRCVLEYQKLFGLDILIETGTYQGDMVRATRTGFREIYSIELGEELYQKTRRLFETFPHIHILHGDSATVLPGVLAEIGQPAMFWLDAHYSGEGTAKTAGDTPILAELDCIFKRPVYDNVILIDDARCFDGQRDYPSMAALKRYVSKRRRGLVFEVKDDIIRIHKTAP